MNITDAMSRLNNNKKLYVMLLKKVDANKLLDDLLDKIKSGDAAAAQASAHTIKGLAANLSLSDLKVKSEAVEQKLKGGAGTAEVDTSEIEESIARTAEAVAAWLKESENG